MPTKTIRPDETIAGLVKELQDSRARYHAIVQNQADMICRFRPDGKLTFVNDAYCRFFGKSERQLVGKSYLPLLPEPDRRVALVILDSLTPENPSVTYERRMVAPGGDQRWQQWTDRAIFNEAGHVVEFQSVGRDITEHRQAVKALEESERKFRSVVEQSSDGIVLIDSDGKVIEWNQSQEKITGIPRAQAMRQPYWQVQCELLLPEHRSQERYLRQEEMLRLACLSRQALWFNQTIVYDFQRADGERRTIESLAFPINTVEHFMIGSIQRDVTEHRRAEQALQRAHSELESRVRERTAELTRANEELRRAEAKYRALVEQMPAVTYISSSDPSAGAQYISPQVELLFGFPASAWLEPNFWVAHIHPDDRAKIVEAFKTCYRSGIPFSGEYRIIARDGRIVYVHDEARAVCSSDGNLIFMQGVMFDISERKLAEAKIQNALQEKEILLRELHHRVKNNLQVISSMLNLQTGVTDDKRLGDIVAKCQSRIDSISLIHEKLYHSSSLAQIDLVDYVRDLVGSLRSIYDAHTPNVYMEIDVQEMSVGIETAVPVGLIIHELVSNALEHAFPSSSDSVSGATDRRTIRLSLHRQTDGQFVLTVQDNGVGFSAGWDPSHSDTLGLQLVDMLVNQLRGTIRCERHRGTTYHILFREVRYKERR